MSPTPPRADYRQDREVLLHTAICNAVMALQVGEPERADPILRQALADYADAPRRVAPKLDDLAEWLRAFVADRSGYSMCKYQTAEIIETIGKALIDRIDELEEQLESRAQPEPQQQGGEGPRGALRVRKKPVAVWAIRLLPHNWGACLEFLGNDFAGGNGQACLLRIRTLEGEMMAQEGDWLIRGVKGEHYPCKPDIFAETYDHALAAPSPAAPVEVTEAMALAAIAASEGDDWRLYDTPETAASRIRVMRAALAAALAAAGKGQK